MTLVFHDLPLIHIVFIKLFVVQRILRLPNDVGNIELQLFLSYILISWIEILSVAYDPSFLPLIIIYILQKYASSEWVETCTIGISYVIGKGTSFMSIYL